MIEGPVHSGDRVRHIRTGGEYVVLFGQFELEHGNSHETLVKIGEDGGTSCASNGWIPAVVYADTNRPNMTFVRDTAQFRRSFERRE